MSDRDIQHSGQGYGGESRTKVAESVCLHAGPGHGRRRRHTGRKTKEA
jgi:hypothetical protein